MVGTVETRYNSSDVVDSDGGIVCATAAILDTATDESFDVSSLLGDRPESIDDVKWHDRLSSYQKREVQSLMHLGGIFVYEPGARLKLDFLSLAD